MGINLSKHLSALSTGWMCEINSVGETLPLEQEMTLSLDR